MDDSKILVMGNIFVLGKMFGSDFGFNVGAGSIIFVGVIPDYI